MTLRGRSGRGQFVFFLAVAGSLLVFPLGGSVRAAIPVVTISAAGVRVEVASAPLTDTIDALSRAAGFKVTYEGSRPTVMLFNAEIESPTVAETLFRLLDGQNLNYGVVFDLTGRKVTSLMVLGPASKKAAATPASPDRPTPRPFTPPRNPRGELPPLDDDPAEVDDDQAEPAVPEPTPLVPSPAPGPQGSGAAPTAPLPPSPFAPRSLVVSPFAPRLAPSPTPSP
jgi:hypothetical protein